ncbi:hypothetical protein MHYP_G00346020 [Metynnis hypsauchen]
MIKLGIGVLPVRVKWAGFMPWTRPCSNNINSSFSCNLTLKAPVAKKSFETVSEGTATAYDDTLGNAGKRRSSVNTVRRRRETYTVSRNPEGSCDSDGTDTDESQIKPV